MRVIVTGSRDFTDEALVHTELEKVLAEVMHVGDWPFWISVGDCPTGADLFTRWWCARSTSWVTVRIFPARWSLLGRSAGPKRNAAMVAAGADLVLAFHAPPPAENKGTAGCVKLARAAGIPVREYGKETPTTTEYEQETLPI